MEVEGCETCGKDKAVGGRGWMESITGERSRGFSYLRIVHFSIFVWYNNIHDTSTASSTEKLVCTLARPAHRGWEIFALTAEQVESV